jgi:hypothetical protein
MPFDLDDQSTEARTTDFVRQARLSNTIPAGMATATEMQDASSADDQRRRIDSRVVLGGCAILLSLIGVWSTMKALALRPPPSCDASPVRLTFGAETAARIETGSGTACTVAVQPGAAVIEDLIVTVAAQHGSIAPRGRTGVVYRAQGNYRGEDSFALALRGRSETQHGVAIVRVRVNVQ